MSVSQGLVAIFLLFIIFHIMYDYTIKGANDEKKKFDFNGFYAYFNW